jgi:hypothetical protein
MTIAVCLVFGQVDYYRVSAHGKPLFSFSEEKYFDGGTTHWSGFGYSIYLHKGELYSVYHGHRWGEGYWTEGPELIYWLPGFSLFNKANLSKRAIVRDVGQRTSATSIPDS